MPTRLPLSRIHTGRHEDPDDGDAPPPTPPPKDPNYTPNHRGNLRVAIHQLPSASSLSCATARRSASATRPPLSRYSSQQEADVEHSPSSMVIDQRHDQVQQQRTPGSAPIPYIRPALEPGTPADIHSTLSSPRYATRRHASDDQLSPPAREHRSFTTRRSKRRARSPPTQLYAPVQAEPSAAVEALFGAAIAAAGNGRVPASTPASPFLHSPMTPDMRRGRSQDGRPPTREKDEVAVEYLRRSNSASPLSTNPTDTETGLLSAKSLPIQAAGRVEEVSLEQVIDPKQQPSIENSIEASPELASATTFGATLDTPFESPAGWLMLDDENDDPLQAAVPEAKGLAPMDSMDRAEPTISIAPPAPLIAASTVHGANISPVHQSTEASAVPPPPEAETSDRDVASSKMYDSEGSSTRSSLESSLFLCLEGGKSTRSSSLTVGDEVNVKEQATPPTEYTHEEDIDDSGEDSNSATANDSSSETANNVSTDDLTALPMVLKQQPSYESMGKPHVTGWSSPAAVAIFPATAAMHRYDNPATSSREPSFDSNVAPWCPKHDGGAYTSTTVTASSTPATTASKSRLGNFFRKSSKSVTSPPPERHVIVQQHARASPATPFDQFEPSYVVNISADGPAPKSARKINRFKAPFGSDLKQWDEDAFRRWAEDSTPEKGAPRRQMRNHSVSVSGGASSPAPRKLSIGAGTHFNTNGGPPPAPSALANLNQGVGISPLSPGRERSHSDATAMMSPPPSSGSAMSNHTTGSHSGGISGFLRRKGSVASPHPSSPLSPQQHGRSMSVSSASTGATGGTITSPRSTTAHKTRGPSRIATSGSSVGRMAGIGGSGHGRNRSRGTTAEFAMAAAMIR